VTSLLLTMPINRNFYSESEEFRPDALVIQSGFVVRLKSSLTSPVGHINNACSAGWYVDIHLFECLLA